MLKKVVKSVATYIYDTYRMADADINAKKNGFKSLEQCNSGKRLLVLANGPSQEIVLNNIKSDIDKYDVFCCNAFPANNRDLFFQIKPKYYCAADPEYYEGYWGTYRTEKLDSLNRVFDETDWDIWFEIYNKGVLIQNKSGKTEFLCNKEIQGGFKVRMYSMYMNNRLLIGSINAPLLMLQTGIEKGYKNIEIAGLDFDYISSYSVDEDNNAWQVIKYGFKPEIKIESSSWPKDLKNDVAAMERYQDIKKLADCAGVEITNLNPRSFITAFKKDNKYYY